MEIPIKVAVRICPPDLQLPKEQTPVKGKSSPNTEKEQTNKIDNIDDSNPENQHELLGAEANPLVNEEKPPRKCCVQSISPPIAPPPGVPPALLQVGPHTFPVYHALPLQCSQRQVYHDTVLPMMSLFMEGFDASVVTYGQKGCGKTYSLYGKGFEDGMNEADHGIVAYFVREIFTHIGNHPERTYTVNITWVEVCREIIKDLFGVGSVQCMSMTDVFHWLQVGYKLLYNSKLQIGHSLFSLTLEQRWISREGLIQHRLSTASFTDLGPTERMFMMRNGVQPIGPPKDLGLQSLEHVVNVLADPKLLLKFQGQVPYNQTMLSAMLKDSFGGRAQTLVVVCVSPWEKDVEETLWNMQFAFKMQLVRNLVVVNAYSDDNTPVPLEAIMPEMPPEQPKGDDSFGLQFAAKQWSKLVANAEELLKRIMSSTALPETEKQHIEEWLLQKQEFEECINSGEVSNSDKNLTAIQEDEEPEASALEDSVSSEADTALRVNSDNDTENESDSSDMDEHLEVLMHNLIRNTDEMVLKGYQEFMSTHPKGVMESLEVKPSKDLPSRCPSEEERKPSVGRMRREDGRRCSLIPGSTLSSADLAVLAKVASKNLSDSDKSKENQEDPMDISSELKPLRKKANTRLDHLHKKLRKLETDIEAKMKQIREVEETMSLKQKIITDLTENTDISATTRQRFNKKRNKLEAEYQKTKKCLNKAVAQKKDKSELERMRANIARLEQRLQDVTSIKDMAGEGAHKLKKMQQSLQDSKNLLESLQKKLKKERKLKDTLKGELKTLQEQDNSQALVKLNGRGKKPEEKRQNLQAVQNRIAHLDQVLQEKSDNLNRHQDNEQREGLRHEIRNLRKTRDHLIEQRYSLDQKLKREKSLSQKEERKLLECAEAIEAIDAAIEFKNELICGHRSIDTSEKLQREKGEQMLMARLNKLSLEEMRTLLYKYFTKVIDLRDSSHKLEMQLMQIESEKDVWEWKERVLSNAVRQAHLEGERNVVRLQRQHEMKLTLMLRHLAEDSCNSSGSFTDQSLAVAPYCHQHNAAAKPLQASDTSYSSYTDSEYEWPHHRQNNQGEQKPLRDLCPTAEVGVANLKSMHKIKEKDSGRETKNKLFAKFQVLTRYATNSHSGGGDDFMMPSSSVATTMTTTTTTSKQRLKDKQSSPSREDEEMALALLGGGNRLRKLSTDSGKTKVTRQKNKLVIQDKTRKPQT